MSGNTQASGFLTQEELDRLLPAGHPVSYPTGTILVREGDQSDFVLYLRSGHIKAITGEPKRIIYIYSPGSIAGELAAILEKPRSADLVCINEVEAHFIPGPVWLEFLMAETRVNLAMMRHLANRLLVNDRPEVESATTSEFKIAKGIWRLLSAGMGKQVADGIRISGVTQRDLGSLSGLSRESAAAVLKRLRETGVVTTGRASLIVKDPAAIERLLLNERKAPLTTRAAHARVPSFQRYRHRL
ncbi:Crp/Fnr family transcriptional regulator [Glycomyces mayteni]|uniref:Crp/Fnr family transcriptional regulator n=1 Tax=Glycomyces mayteni TaxID=543887 RepID=A0ABW2D1M7_9ACTN